MVFSIWVDNTPEKLKNPAQSPVPGNMLIITILKLKIPKIVILYYKLEKWNK